MSSFSWFGQSGGTASKTDIVRIALRYHKVFTDVLMSRTNIKSLFIVFLFVYLGHYNIRVSSWAHTESSAYSTNRRTRFHTAAHISIRTYGMLINISPCKTTLNT